MGGWGDEKKQPPAKKGGFIFTDPGNRASLAHRARCRSGRSPQYAWLQLPDRAVGSGAARDGGEELATNLMLGLDMFPAGGGIVEHTHVTNKEFPVFDHAYYVLFR